MQEIGWSGAKNLAGLDANFFADDEAKPVEMNFWLSASAPSGPQAAQPEWRRQPRRRS